MMHKQVTAVLLSIFLAVSAGAPVSSAGVFAAENAETAETAGIDEEADAAVAVDTAGIYEEAEAAEVAEEADAAGTNEEIEVVEEVAPAGNTEETQTVEAADNAGTVETPETTEPAAATDDTEPDQMMEIICSDGVRDGSGREPKAAANGTLSVDDILSMEIIPADVETASSGCVLAGVPGKYIADQDAALKRINEIRLEACKEGVFNPSTGKKLTKADYVPIKWSRDMEYIARIRAAESALTGTHARTSGKSVWSITGPGGNGSCAEVLAWNWSSSMTDGIDQWYEEKEDWVNQTEGSVTGHYTAMIDPENRYVGIGTFCSEDAYFYNTTAGEFSEARGLDETRMGFSGECMQILEMSTGSLSADGRIIGKLYGARGEKSVHILVTKADYSFWDADVYLMGGVDWSSSNTDVVTVSQDGETTVVKGGSAKLRAASADGNISGEASFVVKEIQDCAITLSGTSFKYDGKEKKPSVTVTYKNKKITEGTDYTIKYSDNVRVGTAMVTVTGKGQFSGSDSRTYEIEKGDQKLTIKEPLAVPVGRKQSFGISGARGKVTVSAEGSEAADVAFTDGTIVVTGRKLGAVKITVKAKETGTYNAAEAVFEVGIVPAASAKVTIYNVAQGLKVTWLAVDGANRYNVYRDGELIKTTSRPEITDSDVKYRSGEKFTYKVAATVKGYGESPLARTGTYYRLMPVGIKSVKNTAPGKMTVTYDKCSGSSGYVVRFGLMSDMSDAKVITVKGEDTLSRTFSGLERGRTYYVQVRTYKIENGIRYYSGYCTTKTVRIE